MNYKFSNRFFLKVAKDFLLEYDIEENLLFGGIEKYINHYYLQNKSRIYKVQLDDSEFSNIIFHKIELNDNNKSFKKAKRVLIFILLNKPDGINTVFPIFSFNTQEEKKYTTQLLHTKDFVYKLFRKFEKYKGGVDYKGNSLKGSLGVEINIK